MTSKKKIKKKWLTTERLKILFSFKRIEWSKKSNRLDRYDQKICATKKRTLLEDLNIGEKVLVLDERINKISASGKFYKQTAQNIFYFNKKTVFAIRNKKKVDKIPIIG